MQSPPSRRAGFTMVELMAVVAIIGIVAMIAVPRFSGGQDDAKRAACQAQRGEIEVQVELWRHETSRWPARNLADIGGDVAYFPEGLPACPVDGSPYAIDSAGRVTGHNH